MGVGVVEAGDVGQGFAAGGEELFAEADVEFFQGLEAIHGEAGAEEGDVFFAFGGQFQQGVARVGLEPFGGAEAGLEAGVPALGGPVQGFAQEAGGLLAMAVVGVALAEIAFW